MIKFTSLALLSIIAGFSFGQCNGFAPLCSKKYNEVAYLTTHNAFANTATGFTLPNHHTSITEQLNGGVRALMLDLYDVGGVVTVYHGITITGTAPFTSNLNEIKDFLDANPNEIVTIILESYVTPDAIEADLTAVGLMPYLFEKGSDPWPALQEMIDDGRRLVIFSDKDEASPSQGWHHYLWDHAVETDFSYADVSEFSCDLNRGDVSNELFILNHFVTDATLGVAAEAQAEIANANPFFINRCNECETLHSKMINFPTVDFFPIGDELAVVNELNNLGDLSTEENLNTTSVIINSNWINETIQVKTSAEISEGKYSILTLTGQTIQAGSINSLETTLSTSSFKAGIYIISITEKSSIIKHQKIIIK
ncbi:MAG: phosphatidylinositol-specific phospholipase C domain-containing protein [Crocinitomicaceae bacterium]|nr:phosphatidylinositol-specific phospholipase C domain-containing protein [Crocinitomicaceae bacterium]